MNRREPQSGLVIRVNTDDGPRRFCVLWRPSAVDVHDCGSVREALTAYREDLLERLSAARALLASDDPDRADRIFASISNFEVTEVVLAPMLDIERFDDLMRRAFEDAREDDE